VVDRIDTRVATRVTRRAFVHGAATCAVVTVAGLGFGFGALAAGEPKEAQANEREPMRMDEPMSGEMMKKGMKKGDVKKAAEEKEREMKEKLEKEEKSMPQGPTKK
jgi:hypothetical protein